MNFKDLKKELQKILTFYSESINDVDEESNYFFDEFNGESECDGYFKLVELSERCRDSCLKFIYDSIPEDYWPEDDEDDYSDDDFDYVDEDSYGYHQKTKTRNQREFYDEDIESYDFNDEGLD